MLELRSLILKEYSKSHSVFVADVLKQKPYLIPELLNIIYLEEEPISRRSAWSLRILFDESSINNNFLLLLFLIIYLSTFLIHYNVYEE